MDCRKSTRDASAVDGSACAMRLQITDIRHSGKALKRSFKALETFSN
jgi:hypothetical protein